MSTHFYIANSILEDTTPEALHRKRERAGRAASSSVRSCVASALGEIPYKGAPHHQCWREVRLLCRDRNIGDLWKVGNAKC